MISPKDKHLMINFSNTSSGSIVIHDQSRIINVVYEPDDLDLLGKFYKYRDEEFHEKYNTNFSKMSIAQAIKTSESQTIEFDRMIEFCKAECCQLYTGEFWFNGSIFSFAYKKVFVSYSRRQISDKDGYNFKNLKELIDYVDSWF